jgi:protein TonB
MSRILFLLLLSIISSLCSTAQTTISTKLSDDRIVYSKVDKMPKFPGGKAALVKFVIDHMEYSGDAAEKGNTNTTVKVQFIIAPNGKVIEPKIIEGASPELNAQALKIVNLMPKWEPGKTNGKKVFVSYNMPIKFGLKE